MTVRELREVKRALKEAQQQAETARKDAEIKERQLERTQAELAEISFIKLFESLGHILQSKKDQRSLVSLAEIYIIWIRWRHYLAL